MESKEEERKYIRIMYVGNRVYDQKSFEREAEKIGVNRAIPPTQAKMLKRGDKIYLAFKRGNFTRIFGYFAFERFTISAPSWFFEEIERKKSEFGIKDVHKGSGVVVTRGCGSYIQGDTYELEEDAEFGEVASKIYKYAKERGVKIKIFAAGSYRRLPKPVRAKLPFTRGIAEYAIPSLDATPEKLPENEKYIDGLLHYEQILRKPAKKKRKRRKKKEGSK